MRPLYLLLSRWWGDEPIPTGPSQAWPQDRLRQAQTWSRYFLVGNIIRAGTIAPAFGFASSHGLILVEFILCYPVAVHFTLIAIEIYKQSVLSRLIPQSIECPYEPQPKYPDIQEVSRKELRLLPFESVNFYRAFGMEWFRMLVMWYASQAMGNEKTIRFMDKSGRRAAVDFAMEACTAEAVHAKGAAINTAALAFLYRDAPLWLNLWVGFWVFAEWLLVLLQRYMRVRVYVALSKRLRRSA